MRWRRPRAGGRLLLGYATANSGMTLGVGVEHVVETPAEHAATSSAGEDLAAMVPTVDAQPSVPSG